MEEKKKQRNDRILICSIILCAISLMGIFIVRGSNVGSTVVVTVSGEVYGKYPLLQEQVITVCDTNTLVIHNGAADMLFADCPDQICVDHSPISMTNDAIICLPNQVVVTIESLIDTGKEPELDAIAK